MPEKKSFNALFRSFLIWFVTFYALFWGYNTFIATPAQEGQKAQLSDLSLEVASDSFVLGRPFNVTLKNNQTVAWNYKEPCALDRQLVVSRVIGSAAPIPLPYSLEQCQESITSAAEIVIPAGGSYTFGFGALNNDFFTEPGTYQVSLPDAIINEKNLTDYTATSFTFKNPGFIRNTFRHLISQPLFNLLVFLVDKLPHHSLGWAIVVMTLLVRMVLIIPNQKAMKSQRKLQKLQPHMQALKKKHGDNQQAVAMETMALYKKHKINPMSSCLPILLQMPFLLGIYFVVRDGIRPQFEHLLYSFQSGVDLSKVDNAFFGLDLSIPNMLVLPIIVGLAQFVAMKLAIPSIPKETESKAVKKKGKKTASKEPDMAAQMQQMQKMMVWVMPIMIAFFTATFPAGVGIYWLTSTVFGIGQQKFVNWQLDRPKVKRKES